MGNSERGKRSVEGDDVVDVSDVDVGVDDVFEVGVVVDGVDVVGVLVDADVVVFVPSNSGDIDVVVSSYFSCCCFHIC